MEHLENPNNTRIEKEQNQSTQNFWEKTDSIIENPCLYLIEKLKNSIEWSSEQQKIILEIINDSWWWKPEQWRASWYISKHEFYWKMTWQLNEEWKINTLACVVMLWLKNWTINSSLENPWKYNYIHLFKNK